MLARGEEASCGEVGDEKRADNAGVTLGVVYVLLNPSLNRGVTYVDSAWSGGFVATRVAEIEERRAQLAARIAVGNACAERRRRVASLAARSDTRLADVKIDSETGLALANASEDLGMVRGERDLAQVCCVPPKLLVP